MTPSNDRLREDDPPSMRTIALSAVMGMLALAGVSGVLTFIVLFAADSRGRWSAPIVTMLALLVVASAIGVWGLLKLRPWKFGGEPLSPATRRTKRLCVWSTLLAVPAAVLLVYGSRGNLAGSFFSNDPIAPAIAIAFIVLYALGAALSWWWYASTDEHDRRACDFGSLVACALFTTVTPLWWVAARADLLPPPNAMVLWAGTNIVLLLGWFWRKYR